MECICICGLIADVQLYVALLHEVKGNFSLQIVPNNLGMRYTVFLRVKAVSIRN
jgi:hypothetical protein